MNKMSDRIKSARSNARLSQRQLAELAGLTQQMISKLENGRSRSTAGIISIAQALNVSPEWLWLGTEKSIQCSSSQCPFSFDQVLFTAWKSLTKHQQAEFKSQIIAASKS